MLAKYYDQNIIECLTNLLNLENKKQNIDNCINNLRSSAADSIFDYHMLTRKIASEKELENLQESNIILLFYLYCRIHLTFYAKN